MTAPGGVAVNDGSEVDPGTPLTFNFNDAMEPTTVRVDLGTTQANLTWATDDRSATISTQGMPSGPLVLQMGSGGGSASPCPSGPMPFLALGLLLTGAGAALARTLRDRRWPLRTPGGAPASRAHPTDDPSC